MKGGRSTGKCERMKGALGMGHLSLEEAHCGGFLNQVPWVMKGRLWGWASLFMVLSWATLSGLTYLGLGEMADRGFRGGAFLSMGSL